MSSQWNDILNHVSERFNFSLCFKQNMGIRMPRIHYNAQSTRDCMRCIRINEKTTQRHSKRLIRSNIIQCVYIQFQTQICLSFFKLTCFIQTKESNHEMESLRKTVGLQPPDTCHLIRIGLFISCVQVTCWRGPLLVHGTSLVYFCVYITIETVYPSQFCRSYSSY